MLLHGMASTKVRQHRIPVLEEGNVRLEEKAGYRFHIDYYSWCTNKEKARAEI